MTKSRGILPRRRFWTAAEIEQLRRRYPTDLTADIARDLGRPLSSTYQKAIKLGLRKPLAVVAEWARVRSSRPGHGGRAHQFRKGHVPWSKGTKGLVGTHPNCRASQFKKGHASTWDPEVYCVGALRLNHDGGLDMKVRDGGYRYGDPQWVPLHRWVWERQHGPVPKGMAVRAHDGDLHNTQIENLYLVTRAELMRANTVHNLPKPLAQAIQLRGALNRKINRIVKEQQDECREQHRRPAQPPLRNAGRAAR